MRRAELEDANGSVLIVQRGHHDIAKPRLDQALLDAPAVPVGCEVVHDERLPVGHRSRVHGTREVMDAQMLGVREDAAVLQLRAVVQDENSFSVEGGQSQAELGAAEVRAELALQPLEARAGHDRLLLDEVALERGQDLLVGDIGRLDHREAAEDEAVRRDQLHERPRIGEIAPGGGGDWRRRGWAAGRSCPRPGSGDRGRSGSGARARTRGRWW